MTPRTSRLALLLLTLLLAFSTGPVAARQDRDKDKNTPPYKNLKWRLIGPHRGGRVAAVAGVASQPLVYYFGATGGGLWKTTDGGVNWAPISDGAFKTGSVGAVGVADSDPNVIYVGMGESPIRGNVSHGDGLYKSTDAGKTWKHVGLDDTRHIGRVRVHPKNPDVAYVAALGHAFGPNEQRGVFRTTDGGKTWQKVFSRGDKAGAVDLVLDPSNPRVMYAGFWEVVRRPHTFESGGPGSGLFKSTDGGDTWTDLTRNPGLPKKLVGKVGVTVSPANPNRVWTIIEAEDGGVFRSDDGGEKWTKVNDERKLRQRAWYYSHIYADPKNAESVYVLNVGFFKSNDGGRTFNSIGVPHGDNHDLWIAPDDPQRMIEGNDGGANVSVNGGRAWTEQDQATAQFYRVALDNDFPYNLYGAQQDNSTVRIASRTMNFGITERDWYPVGGGESGWIAPHPKDSSIVFAGSYGGYLSRYDHRTKQLRDVTVWPDSPIGHGAEGMKYRFQWNAPLLFSTHDQNTLYAGGNVLFRTTNEGQGWEAMSPDLTRNDPSKLGPSGGPITKDNTGVEYYCTIFAVSESPVRKGVIWTGSDDGLVHVTRDDGKTWDKVTPKDLPEWAQINSIDASPHDPATAYVAATMYKSDDFRPYLYKTTDFGKTWTKIVSGIPDAAFTRVVREDPHRRGLLYAGTETGMYMSFDDGKTWQSLQLNLPAVPITDLAVHKRDRDLVVATQGRSFWILDDLTVLHQMNDEIAKADAHLFKPEDAYRADGFAFPVPPEATFGQNPPNGASIWMYFKDKPKNEITVEILDSSGKVLRKATGKAEDAEPTDAPGRGEGGPGGGRRGDTFKIETGLNRWTWDLRCEGAKTFPGMILWDGETRGPRVAPGPCQVRLTIDGKTQTQGFEVLKNPNVAATPEDFAAQFDILLKIRDKLSETHEAITQIRDLRRQIEGLSDRLKGEANKPLAETAKSIKDKLTAVEEALYQTKLQSDQDVLNFPLRLNNKLASLAGVIDGADARPTDQSVVLCGELIGKIDAELQKLDKIRKEELPAFNRAVDERDVPYVIEKPSGDGKQGNEK